MNNQTMQFMPSELYFSMGRLAAIFSLLLIVMLAFVAVFLLFYQQRNTTRSSDEREQFSDTEPSIIEQRTIELSHYRQYSSIDANQWMAMTALYNADIDEQLAGSKMNLIASNSN